MVNAVNDRLSTHDAMCSIVFNIHQLLHNEPNWKVFYVTRELNRGADCLANYACITLLEFVWVEDFLPILSTLCRKKNNILICFMNEI